MYRFAHGFAAAGGGLYRPSIACCHALLYEDAPYTG